MSTTGKDLDLVKPKTTDSVLQTIGDLGNNFQKIDDEVTAHLAENAIDDVHGLLTGGKIIQESGSNENGRYVRFADGTQVCQMSRAVAVEDLTSGIKTRTWTFPAMFLLGASYSVEYQFSPANTTDADRVKTYTTQRNQSRTGVKTDVYLSLALNLDATSSEDFTAIGRWK